MTPRSVLILHASVGAGHTRAAQALAAALALEAPQARVVVADVLDVSRPAFRRVYSDGYLELIERAPSLFGALFALTDRPGGGGWPSRIGRAVARWGMTGFDELLNAEKWDVVASTHFLASELVADAKSRGLCTAPLATVVTDFDAHALWAQFPTELYCVAGPAAASSLMGCGVPEEAIVTTGIPIDPAFSEPADRAAAFRLFGLSGGYPLVVQSAGGRGVGPIADVTRALLASTVPSELVVVCGRNDAARREIEALEVPSRHRLKIMGFTQEMRALMGVADVLVTKPGGLTVSEALASALPMALVSPIPGQEERNADYLLENGAAIKAVRPQALTAKIEDLLASPTRLDAMRAQAERLGRPKSSYAVARQLLSLAERHTAAANSDETLSAPTAAVRASHWAIPGLQIKAETAADAATAA